MIRVLVAEDELPLLRGISKMIECCNADMQVVKMAVNGKEAIDFIQENPVDVIFTDINMPIIDGLEILHYANKNMPHVITVVISGYRDFSFAQKALRYQAKNYLLKPIDKKELSDLTKQIVKEVLDRKKEIKTAVLRDICYGSENSVHAEIFTTLIPVYFVAGAFCASTIDEGARGYAYWKKNNLKDIAENAAKIKSQIFLFFGKSLNEQILLFEIKSGTNIKKLVKNILQVLDDCLPISAVIGSEISDVAKIQESLEQMRAFMEKNILYGKGGIVEEDRDGVLFRLSEEAESVIQYTLLKKNFKGFTEILMTMCEQINRQGITQHDLEHILRKIFFIVEMNSIKKAESRIEDIQSEISDILQECKVLDNAISEFITLCHNAMQDNHNENRKELMVQIDEYIRNHYSEDINTKILAANYGMVIFKPPI